MIRRDESPRWWGYAFALTGGFSLPSQAAPAVNGRYARRSRQTAVQCESDADRHKAYKRDVRSWFGGLLSK
jgi:hypothetical protein